MQIQKRAARAVRRAKTMRLRRMGVPCTSSKWGWQGEWTHRQHLTPGEVQSNRRLARSKNPGMRIHGERGVAA